MKKLIEIKNLAYDIPYSGSIIGDVSLELGPSEFLGVLGHNGAGKSTFLDLLMGFRNTDKGFLRVLDEDPKHDKRLHKDKIAYLSHEANLKGNISVRQFLDFSSVFYPKYSKDEEARYLKLFGMKEDDRIGTLSTGQQKKIQFIAAAAARPELLIIDEITAVFDPEFRKIFFNELLRLKELHQTSIILATNIADDLQGFASRILFFKDGKASFHSHSEIAKLFNSEAA